MANEEQFEYWNEDAGPKWVAAQKTLDESLGSFTNDLLHSAKLEAGLSVLDVGCGTGQTTAELFRRSSPGGSVLGVDLSSVMLDAAGVRAVQEGVSPSFRQADAQIVTFGPMVFDRIVSRFGVMFFEDPVVAFANLRSAIRPGGRLSFLCWQSPKENSWVSLPMSVARRFIELPPGEEGAPGPFAFADQERIRTILETAGWANVTIQPRLGQMRFGDGSVTKALDFMQQIGPLSRVFAQLDSAELRASVLAALEEALDNVASTSADGRLALSAATWLVEATDPE